MSYLVDANVLSEATKPSPDLRIIAWPRSHEAEIIVDPVIVGEIRHGISLLRRGAPRDRLARWFDSTQPRDSRDPLKEPAGNRATPGPSRLARRPSGLASPACPVPGHEDPESKLGTMGHAGYEAMCPHLWSVGPASCLAM